MTRRPTSAEEYRQLVTEEAALAKDATSNETRAQHCAMSDYTTAAALMSAWPPTAALQRTLHKVPDVPNSRHWSAAKPANPAWSPRSDGPCHSRGALVDAGQFRDLLDMCDRSGSPSCLGE